MKQRRERVQVVLVVLPGAEPWLKVEHSAGWFKVPLHASAEEVVRGARERWTQTPKQTESAEVWVRVPLRIARQLRPAQ